MDRVEVARTLAETEEQIKVITDNIRAMSSLYYKSGKLSIRIETEDFHDKGSREDYYFSRDLLKEYLEKELERLQKISVNLLEKLSGEGD